MQLSSRGQGATEYLVLLAVVLIIALVSISLLGFFPGTADDSKLKQTQIYWQSASPIAVIEGVGTEASWIGDMNGIKLTLKNNGGTTLQLLAISQAKPHAIKYPIERSDRWEYFSPEYLGDYQVYIAPPRGTGTISNYNQPIMLAPGETITVGMAIYNQALGGIYPTRGYPTRVCKDIEGNTGKFMELPEIAFYYRQQLDGGIAGPEKIQVGSKPIILPCTPEALE